MKMHLAKVSLALLSAVFLLGCQEPASSPVGLEDLGPQFDKKSNGPCPVERLRGHCHVLDPQPPTTNPLKVTITGTEISASEQDMSGPGLNDVDLLVDLSSFPAASCNLGTEVEGQLFIAQGEDHVHVSFSFTHKVSGSGVESQHALSMDGVLQSGALPPVQGTDGVIVASAEGLWSITSKGKNHKNGCKANGAGLDFTVTIVQPPPA